MWVDMLMVDVNSGNPQIDGHKRCKRKNMKRLGGGGLPLHIFANLKSNNSHKNAFINPSWKVWGEKGDEQVAAKKELLEHFKTLETELGDKTYCGGEVFRFLDIALMGYYSWFKAMEKFGEFSIETEFPKLTEKLFVDQRDGVLVFLE